MKWYESDWALLFVFALGYMAAAAAFLIFSIKEGASAFVKRETGPQPKQKTVNLEEACGCCEHGTSFMYSCEKCNDADMVEDFLEKLCENPPLT